MNYTVTKKETISELIIETNTIHGTIFFAWDNNNEDFINKLNHKGMDAFVNLLIDNPNTAYNQFVNGI